MVSSQRFGILVGLNGFLEHRWDTRCFDKGTDGIVREKDFLLGYVHDGRAERFGIRSDLRLMIPVDLP